MRPKKSADQLIQDLLAGNFDLSHASPEEEQLDQLSQQLEQSYDLSAETIQASLVKYKSQIQDATGFEWTDDQLVALSGGKGNHVKLTQSRIVQI
jgi:hypothetical protein